MNYGAVTQRHCFDSKGPVHPFGQLSSLSDIALFQPWPISIAG